MSLFTKKIAGGQLSHTPLFFEINSTFDLKQMAPKQTSTPKNLPLWHLRKSHGSIHLWTTIARHRPHRQRHGRWNGPRVSWQLICVSTTEAPIFFELADFDINRSNNFLGYGIPKIYSRSKNHGTPTQNHPGLKNHDIICREYIACLIWSGSINVPFL